MCVVENFRPDVKKRLGIDYKTLAKINPQLVYASISGFGQDGPYANRPGFDQIAQGMGGLMSITGLPGQGPVRVGIPIADLSAGLFASLGILVALLEREKSRKGQQVTSSLLQAQIFMLDFQAARYLVQGEVAKQAGNNHPTSIPTGVFKTEDGYINIATAGQTDLEAVLRSARRAGACEKSGLRQRRRRARKIAMRSMPRSTSSWSARPAMNGSRRLNEAGVPCGPIYNIDQMFADPQVKHLGIAQSVTKKDKSKMYLVGQPSRCRARRRSSWHGRRSSASTPTPCSRNSASASATSPRCIKHRRFDGLSCAIAVQERRRFTRLCAGHPVNADP